MLTFAFLHDTSIKHLKEKSKALDLGCGTGRTINELLKHDFTVIGIDVSSEMIKLEH